MSLLSSLTNRIFLASAALVVVSISVAVYRVNVSVTARAEIDLRQGLDEAATLVDELSRTEFDGFVREARLIADLPKLQNATATGDPATVKDVADEYQRLMPRADLFLVGSSGGRVLAQAGRITPQVGTLDQILAARPNATDATWLWPYPGGVLQVAAVPIELFGLLIVGSSLDQSLADHIKASTNSDIAIAAGNRIIASTLRPEHAATLALVLGRARDFNVRLDGEEYIARVQPLGRPGANADAAVAIVLRSRTEQLRFLSGLQGEIVATGLVAVLIATLVGYGIARTVTRPLRAVTATMRDMAATGDLARQGPSLGRWDDEDARLLATTFRQLATSLDRFQREATQRERLSSLGRLSTVIAHEIRNPLMIIKMALRGLRGSPTPHEVSGTSASIEEEVSRLNRVVSDVLDFAKPIHFELAETDLAELCRGAALAAGSGAEDVRINVDAEANARIVTDAERLRAVLVNVLTNAQHAVRARHPDGESPAIRLRAGRAGSGRWQIHVEDQGIGIALDDLPRVFEPFFTTRQTGSGLGLALARNVVEGLGGSIAVRSRVNEGTTVHLELPGRAPQTGGVA